MGRNPVHNDGNAVLMQGVDEEHKVLWGSVSAGGSEVADGLISPRSVEGMFRNGKELDMGESHLFHVFRQDRSHFPVRQKAVVFFGDSSPGTQMNFINGDGCVQAVDPMPVSHPLLISPGVAEVPNPGGRLRGDFPAKRERVSFVDYVLVALRDDMVFVKRPFGDGGNESFPDSRLVPSGAERAGLRVPSVKIPDDRYRFRVRRPDGKIDPLRAPSGHRVGAQFFMETEMIALAEKVNIMISQ